MLNDCRKLDDKYWENIIDLSLKMLTSAGINNWEEVSVLEKERLLLIKEYFYCINNKNYIKDEMQLINNINEIIFYNQKLVTIAKNYQSISRKKMGNIKSIKRFYC